jgi:hypothetical protein
MKSCLCTVVNFKRLIFQCMFIKFSLAEGYFFVVLPRQLNEGTQSHGSEFFDGIVCHCKPKQTCFLLQ